MDKVSFWGPIVNLLKSSKKNLGEKIEKEPMDNHQNEIEEKIKELAYYKWIDAGMPDGKDMEFWLEAEQEIYSTFSQRCCG